MGHDFETRSEITVDATPEQVWAAIATGPGIDSWFMGRNEVEPREGGTARMSVSDQFTMESTVTSWDPPRHFAIRSADLPDGTFHAFSYLVEGREGGSTVVRMVHSGFLGQDDWETEYDALRKGDPMYLGSLRTYLAYFPGRTATPVSAWAPPLRDEETAWRGIVRGLGMDGKVAEGAAVRFQLPGTPEVTGVVDAVLYPSFLSVRTDDALLKFVGGFGQMGVGHHIYSPVEDRGAAEDAWHTWLTSLYA